MKYTKANIVKLLEAIGKNYYKIANYEKKKGNDTNYRIYLNGSMAIDEAIWLLTKKEYFDKIATIFANEVSEKGN